MKLFLLVTIAVAVTIAAASNDAGQENCPEGEVFGCHSRCPLTCSHYTNPPSKMMPCPAICDFKCDCAYGTIRRESDDKCVKKEYC
nr:venom peptide SjAPI-2 [Parasteatoda tepidariorum]